MAFSKILFRQEFSIQFKQITISHFKGFVAPESQQNASKSNSCNIFLINLLFCVDKLNKRISKPNFQMEVRVVKVQNSANLKLHVHQIILLGIVGKGIMYQKLAHV